MTLGFISPHFSLSLDRDPRLPAATFSFAFPSFRRRFPPFFLLFLYHTDLIPQRPLCALLQDDRIRFFQFDSKGCHIPQ